MEIQNLENTIQSTSIRQEINSEQRASNSFNQNMSQIILDNSTGLAQSLNNKSNSGKSLKTHVCAICGDKATGNHYGVHSCEGCKGFFKRTVRKDLTYSCRDLGKCIVDKRQRNRCQYCRYHKCLSNGMKREQVQDERQKYRHKHDSPNGSPSSFYEFKEELKDTENPNELNDDLSLTYEENKFLEKINKAEELYNPEKINSDDSNSCSVDELYESIEIQLNRIPQWAKSVDLFQQLDIDDQVSLLRENWREILCLSLAHRSIHYDDTLLLASGNIFHSSQKDMDENLKYLVDRLIEDIVNLIKDLDIDRVELALLKLMLLFDSNATLNDSSKVNEIRDSICVTLSKYCRRDQFSSDPTRFAKLLLRLPPIRSWVLSGTESVMSIKATNNFDSILVESFVKNQKKI